MKHSSLLPILGLVFSTLAMAEQPFQHAYENGGYWEAMPPAVAAQTDMAFTHEYENGGHWGGRQQSQVAEADEDSWSRSELVWSAAAGDYVAMPTLGADLFQTQLVWSDLHHDYVPRGQALLAYYAQPVWSAKHNGYVARAEVKIPCPSFAKTPGLTQIAGLY